MRNLWGILGALGLLLAGLAAPLRGEDVGNRFEDVAEWTAVTGFEEPAHVALRSWLPPGLDATADPLGNFWVRFGDPDGPPDRIVAAPLDEPGFVVSRITEDGYLRVQSCHRRDPGPLWIQWHQGRKVVVITRDGPIVGAVAIPSVHLRRGRRAASTEPAGLEDIWIDIGADNPAEARAMGIRLLDPVAYRKRVVPLAGDHAAGPGLGTRWGSAVLLELAHAFEKHPPDGSVVLLWLGQEALGRKGADAAAQRFRGARELTLLGIDPSGGEVPPDPAGGPVWWAAPGDRATPPDGWQPREFDPEKTPRALYTGGPDWEDTAQRYLGVPVRYAGSTSEVLSLEDVRSVTRYLAGSETAGPGLHVSGELARNEVGGGEHRETAEVLAALTLSAGVSGHEAPVREAIRALLPDRYRDQLRTDEEGNYILELAANKDGPALDFIAHMDEIGYEIAGFEDDGRALVRRRGGFLPAVFEAHPVIVHTANGPVTGTIAPRAGYAEADSYAVSHDDLRLDLGTNSRVESEKLAAVGDSLHPLKEFHRMGPHRAVARSFDDRVGCAALVLALRHVDPARVRGRVTFAWSVREEVGLDGAKHMAETLPTPDFVFAVDTFVSSDSPLESRRFGWAPLGEGAVLRALDNSNVTPPDVRDAILALARKRGIALQYGVTGGGNDGSVFTRHGAIDVPIAWPMRNSHTPAEIIDLRDVEQLAALIEALVTRDWEPSR